MRRNADCMLYESILRQWYCELAMHLCVSTAGAAAEPASCPSPPKENRPRVHALEQTGPAMSTPTTLSHLTREQRDAFVRESLGNKKIDVSRIMLARGIFAKCVRLEPGTYHWSGTPIHVDHNMDITGQDRLTLYCPAATLRSKTHEEQWAACTTSQGQAKGCFTTSKECLDHIRQWHPDVEQHVEQHVEQQRGWDSLDPQERHSLIFHLHSRAQTTAKSRVKDGVNCSLEMALPAGPVTFAYPLGTQTCIKAIIPQGKNVYFCRHAPPQAFERDVSFDRMGRCNRVPRNGPIFTLVQSADKHSISNHSLKR